MSKITIIGSGFSSAVLSKNLKEKDVLIFDKGRGPGGRSSTRRVEHVGVFDHGLQFISPKEKEFELFLKQHLTSFVKEWDGEFILFEDNKKIEKKKYIGKSGNNDFVKKLIRSNAHYQKELLSIEKKIKNGC